MLYIWTNVYVPDDVSPNADSSFPSTIKGAIAPRLAPAFSHSPRVSDADAETRGSSPSEEGVVVARMVVMVMLLRLLRAPVRLVFAAPPRKTQADAGLSAADTITAVRARSHWLPHEGLIIGLLSLLLSIFSLARCVLCVTTMCILSMGPLLCHAVLPRKAITSEIE